MWCACLPLLVLCLPSFTMYPVCVRENDLSVPRQAAGRGEEEFIQNRGEEEFVHNRGEEEFVHNRGEEEFAQSRRGCGPCGGVYLRIVGA